MSVNLLSTVERACVRFGRAGPSQLCSAASRTLAMFPGREATVAYAAVVAMAIGGNGFDSGGGRADAEPGPAVPAGPDPDVVVSVPPARSR